MNRTIGWWTLTGLAVACCWVLVAMLVSPSNNLAHSTFVAITAPASLLGRKVPLGVFWFILLNGALYAGLGLIFELIRKLRAHSAHA